MKFKRTFAEKALAIAEAKRRKRRPQIIALALLVWVALIATCSGIAMYLGRIPTKAPYATHVAVQSVDAPPDNITVNGERWRLIAFDFRANKGYGDTAAETDCSQRVIWYVPKEATAAQLREDLWHEVVHAGFCGDKGASLAHWAQFTKDYPEHGAVYAMGMFLPSFVHDNPEFVQWSENWK